MRIIIAGGRDFSDYDLLESRVSFLTHKIKNITIVSGTANGADRLGERYARAYKLSLISVPANWDRYGKSAGFIRNTEMMEISDLLIAFWDGRSKGTAQMIDIFKRSGKRYKVIKY